MATTISSLNNDVIKSHIFPHLSGEDLKLSRLVCSLWDQLVRECLPILCWNALNQLSEAYGFDSLDTASKTSMLLSKTIRELEENAQQVLDSIKKKIPKKYCPSGQIDPLLSAIEHAASFFSEQNSHSQSRDYLYIIDKKIRTILLFDIKNIFSFNPHSYQPLGFISQMQIGDIDLRGSYQITNPSDEKIAVVAVMSHFVWTRIGPLCTIDMHISPADQTQMRCLKFKQKEEKSALDITLMLTILVYDQRNHLYVPLERKRKRGFSKIEGVVLKGKIGKITIDKSPFPAVEQPINYRCRLRILLSETF